MEPSDHQRWRLPPEWHRQDWLWIGFPHDAAEWPGSLGQAQAEIAAFASAIATSGQRVRLVVRDAAHAARARSLCSAMVDIEEHVYGDIWLRDTGPLVLCDDAGARVALRFGFNGWGGKYVLAGDEAIGAALARAAGLAVITADGVLEGGAIDGDGEGRLVTTAQCLLNPNRNPGLGREEITARLKATLGVREVVWLSEGLVNDHTDGHVDNLARFVAPGALAVPRAASPDDPNAAIYADAAACARAAGLVVHDVPSPGRVELSGVVAPASYMNFVITNHLVVVPTFGVAADAEAVAAIGALFPGRDTIGLSARWVLAGGGGFHCASQQCASALAPMRGAL